MEQWISIHDMTPAEDVEVIVLVDCDGMPMISFGHTVDEERCIGYDGWSIPDVTHWMPCPSLPAYYIKYQ